MIVQLPNESLNKGEYGIVELNLEFLNNNTLEFIELQCKNIITNRRIMNPPEGTTVLKRKDE